MNFWRHKAIPAPLPLPALSWFLAAPTRAQENAASLYKTKCVVRNAADGSGNTPVGKSLGAPGFAAEGVRKETDERLVEITAKGRNKMPAYEKSLKDAEIKFWSLISARSAIESRLFSHLLAAQGIGDPFVKARAKEVQ